MLGTLEIIGLTLVAAVLTALAQYFFKTNIRNFEFNLRRIAELLSKKGTMAGVCLYFVGLVFYIYALSNEPVISLIYPIFASTFIFVLLISKYTLNEPVHARRIIGVVLIAIGIGVVALTFPV